MTIRQVLITTWYGCNHQIHGTAYKGAKIVTK
jgi:hypothetical protein